MLNPNPNPNPNPMFNENQCSMLDYCMFQVFNQITNRNNPNE